MIWRTLWASHRRTQGTFIVTVGSEHNDTDRHAPNRCSKILRILMVDGHQFLTQFRRIPIERQMHASAPFVGGRWDGDSIVRVDGIASYSFVDVRNHSCLICNVVTLIDVFNVFIMIPVFSAFVLDRHTGSIPVVQSCMFDAGRAQALLNPDPAVDADSGLLSTYVSATVHEFHHHNSC